MNPYDYLDWAVMAISLINTILLLWLGLTVLLNAERRTWGAWVAGGGLLLGGLFFISHTAILGVGLENAFQELNFWWYIGWIPVVALPYSWYVVMLWYAGFWEDRNTALFARQRYWFTGTTVLTAALMGALIFFAPLPTYNEVLFLNLDADTPLGGFSLLMLIYPLYIIMSIALSLDALRRPGPSGRVMGDIARQRARPWLVATSFTLLLVSLLVSWVMYWMLQSIGENRPIIESAILVTWFDLIISTLIGISLITLGQAVVAYEIFTGKALPRRGFLRQWRRAIVLAVGYGVTIGWALTNHLQSIYLILITAFLMTFFYALLGWRSYTERQRYIRDLRPFVASQGLFDQLLSYSAAEPNKSDFFTPFRALCRDVLGTNLAYLVPIGSLAPLVEIPLTYPKDREPNFPELNNTIARFSHAELACLPVQPKTHSGARWVVPLWSERGMIGLLFLGEKFDGGLYTEEEIEIAQTSGERLVDSQASTEIAQRLMALQRQRLAESQLLDQRARRVLHDEVLQQLHTAMLKLVQEQSKPNGGNSEAIKMLADVHSQISDLLREMPTTSLPEIAQIGLIGALRKVVNEELGLSFDEVHWEIDPVAELEAQAISSLTAEVIYYAAREAIRNAARHGRTGEGNRPLHLRVSIRWEEGLIMDIEDDGVGVKGSGGKGGGSKQGLALHSTMMAVVGGELSLESQPGEFTRVSLTLPQNAYK